MKRLWAPWRMKYIKSSRIKGCFLCKYLKSRDDRKNLILYRGDKSFIILNRYPYNSGHLMVAPNSHKANLKMLTPEETIEIIQLVVHSMEILKKVFSPMGFNIGINIGRVAGAGLEDHIHFHVVPRWEGDTNFMPVSADTKIVPQLLDETYMKLKSMLR